MSHTRRDQTEERKKKKDAEKLQKFIDVYEQTKKKVLDVDDLIGDSISDFERQRIKSDLERERERKKIREQRVHERQERERLGASAWFDQRAERLKQDKKEEREIQADSVAHDVAVRKEIREARRTDRQEMDDRHVEYEKMQKLWKEEDESREREKSLDEKREREVVWARLESKKAALTRDREEWKKEREKREEQRAIEKELREKRWEAEKERDHSVAQDLLKVQDKHHREKHRYLNRHQASSASENEFQNLEANSQFRETFRSKGHASARSRRLHEGEAQMADLERWYKNRSYDRFERNREVARTSIYR